MYLEILLGKVKLKEILMLDDVIRNKSLFGSLETKKSKLPQFHLKFRDKMALSEDVMSSLKSMYFQAERNYKQPHKPITIVQSHS